MADENGEVEPAAEPVPPQGLGSLLREALGCLIPLAVVFGFLLLALWTYRVVIGPGGPVPVETGEVKALELRGSDGREYIGRKCRVFPDWVTIEADGAVVVIPRERVETIRVVPSR